MHAWIGWEKIENFFVLPCEWMDEQTLQTLQLHYFMEINIT